jgi:hypothetical protein
MLTKDEEEFTKRREGEDDDAYVARLKAETVRLNAEGNAKFVASYKRAKRVGVVLVAWNIAVVIFGFIIGWRTWIVVTLIVYAMIALWSLLTTIRAFQKFTHLEELAEKLKEEEASKEKEETKKE